MAPRRGRLLHGRFTGQDFADALCRRHTIFVKSSHVFLLVVSDVATTYRLAYHITLKPSAPHVVLSVEGF